MAKTKTPYFSIGAHGTVGGSITAQKLAAETMLRGKPLPTDPYSLAQAYQRWLYEDYAYLWRQQSAATQALYRSAGVRHHLTGFQYWMKDMLARLPDIAGMWHLDAMSAPTTPDSSRNTNTGTIIGASPIDGLINGAAYFDGLNDRIDCGNHQSLNMGTSDFSLAFYCYLPSAQGPPSPDLINKGAHAANLGFKVELSNRLTVVIQDAGGFTVFTTPVLTFPAWYSVVANFDRDANGQIFYNAIPSPPVNIAARSGSIDWPINFVLGTFATQYWKGTLDHVILRTRILDLTEITRHSQRRYPP